MAFNSETITGIFTLTAVIVTWTLTKKGEKATFLKEFRLKEYYDLETFYISVLSSLDKTIRFTERGLDYSELFEQNSLLSAKANIIASKEINEQFYLISNLIYEWSSLYRQSLPTKVGNTRFGVISNLDLEFKAEADKLFPEIRTQIGNLVSLIKIDLSRVKTELKN